MAGHCMGIIIMLVIRGSLVNIAFYVVFILYSRYIESSDGTRRLQTVRLIDKSLSTTSSTNV